MRFTEGVAVLAQAKLVDAEQYPHVIRRHTVRVELHSRVLGTVFESCSSLWIVQYAMWQCYKGSLKFLSYTLSW